MRRCPLGRMRCSRRLPIAPEGEGEGEAAGAGEGGDVAGGVLVVTKARETERR